MTVREYLRTQTNVHELCVIRDCGYIVASCWIDHEDLFMIPEGVANKHVRNTRWGGLLIRTPDGDEREIPCHFIELY